MKTVRQNNKHRQVDRQTQMIIEGHNGRQIDRGITRDRHTQTDRETDKDRDDNIEA